MYFPLEIEDSVQKMMFPTYLL